MTLYVKRGHFAQNMNIELLVSADSAGGGGGGGGGGGALYNVVQAALRSHLPFMRYKRKCSVN